MKRDVGDGTNLMEGWIQMTYTCKFLFVNLYTLCSDGESLLRRFLFSQRAEKLANLVRQQLRLLKGREVPALRHF